MSQNFDVKKAIEQHTKVIDLIKQECDSNWVAFYSVSYFRRWDSFDDCEITTYNNRTKLHTFDEWKIRKVIDDDFKPQDNE